MKTHSRYLLITSLLLASTPAMATQSYECWRYVDGSPQGYVTVSASSKAEAVRKGEQKFKDMGKKYDRVKCK